MGGGGADSSTVNSCLVISNRNSAGPGRRTVLMHGDQLDRGRKLNPRFRAGLRRSWIPAYQLHIVVQFGR